jgi:adenosylmethionine-8-amino-7-oxononanoate aminotransferase
VGSVFLRGTGTHSVAVRGDGVWIEDADGNRYLDAAGGAIVSGIGHGDAHVVRAMTEQASRLAYVHPTAFTTDAVETYAAEVAAVVPMDEARVYPVSGGSEAVETALKLARAYHLAKGERDRSVVIGRELSYHGNTRGALDVSGRRNLRSPYLPWLGLAGRVPGVLEYRCPNQEHPVGCSVWHADQLVAEIERVGPERVAAFIAEPIGGAASGAAVPPEGYWDAVGAVCGRYGVLIIADEVMTGFGRTGRWFASEHFGLRPDLLVSAKGASSGYWPLGITVAAAHVHDAVAAGGGFVHGFTSSHHAVGAAVGTAVLGRIRERGLVAAAVIRGEQLLAGLRRALAGHPRVGDVRGKGLLVAIEIVADRETKRPYPQANGTAARVTKAARATGLLVYPSGGCADGENGDLLLLGPPLVISEEEVDLVVARTATALAVLK